MKTSLPCKSFVYIYIHTTVEERKLSLKTGDYGATDFLTVYSAREKVFKCEIRLNNRERNIYLFVSVAYRV